MQQQPCDQQQGGGQDGGRHHGGGQGGGGRHLTRSKTEPHCTEVATDTARVLVLFILVTHVTSFGQWTGKPFLKRLVHYLTEGFGFTHDLVNDFI